MPNLIIHVISLIVLFLLILLFNQDYRKNKKLMLMLFALLLASNLIDLDHLVANPIYDPTRCSIGFHPLHGYYMFPLLFLGTLFKKTRYISIAILLHLSLDGLDCII